MTPKERMRIAMQRGKADRVPFMCQLSVGHLLKNSSVRPIDVWLSAEGFARAVTECCTEYNMDGTIINVWPDDRNWRDKIESVESTPTVDRVVFKDGKIVNYFIDGNIIQENRETSRDDWEERLAQVDPAETVAAPIAEEMYDVLDVLNSGMGKEKSIHWEITTPYLWHLHNVTGVDEALLALMLMPEKCHEFSEVAVERLGDIAIGAIDRGCDAIVISSPFAGGSFISRDQYSEFVVPYEREVIQRIHERKADMPVYIHTCGFLGDRLDLMLESGCNGIECLDPPPLGNVELEEAVEVIAGRAFIKGNIDSVNCLLRCSLDEIRADAAKRIGIAGKNGAYILSTSCSVAPDVPPAALHALYETVCTVGRYDEG